ncbi:hypothetical protein HK101_011492 [Irineochytrium annulatum]|nr:hypothetical protein HK101_011492 [Irineochytrium annulatum]
MEASLPGVYACPKFGNRNFSPLRSYSLFLSSISGGNGFAMFVTRLDLRAVEESLYESLDDSWLAIILRKCSKLEYLTLSGCSFLTDRSVNRIHSPPPNPDLGPFTTHASLRHLDLSHTDISPNSLIMILRSTPTVRSLDLSRSRSLNDASLIAASELLVDLEELRLDSPPTSVTPKLLSSLVFPNLKSLSISDCPSATDDVVSRLVTTERHRHLASLSLTTCPVTRLSLVSISTIPATPPLTHLSLRRPPRRLPSIPDLSSLFAALAPTLRHLAIPYPTFIAPHHQLKFELAPAFRLLAGNLETLTLGSLDDRAPHHVIRSIAAEWVPSLRGVRLIRDGYESDWNKGFYANVEKGALSVDEKFVEGFNAVYGQRCWMTLELEEEAGGL